MQGTLPSRGREIWPRANIHIIFLSVSSVEETPLFRGKGHFLNPRVFLHSWDTLVLRTWLTTKRVDKLKCSLITMIAAFTTWTIIISFKLKLMYCTCRNNNATICWRKVNCDFLFSCLKNDNCSRFQNLNKSFVGQLLANPLPNLYSRDTSTVYSGDSPDNFLSSEGVPSPEQKFHCSNVSISINNWRMHFSAWKFQNSLGKHAPRKKPPFCLSKARKTFRSMQRWKKLIKVKDFAILFLALTWFHQGNHKNCLLNFKEHTD